MVDDQRISQHYSLYQLLHTDHADFVEMNHQVTNDQIAKLARVADLCEIASGILEVPLAISSGYRCPALNKAVGSSDRSQHLLCEAADSVPKGMSVLDAFKKLRQVAKEGKILFGQMIYEKASRGYSGGAVEWVHLSLGTPYRPKERCGEILTMADGTYTLLEQVSV